MSLPIKAALLGAATVVIGGTGIWLATSGGMPEWTSLDQDAGFSDTSGEYNNKYAAKYARFLTGMGATTAAGTDTSATQTKSNDDWWKWSFNKNYSSEKDKGGFNKDNQDLADASALKEKCNEAYKAETGKVKILTGSATLGTGEFSEDKLWKFCSFNGVKPKTVENVANESSSYSSKVGDTNKAELLSLESKDNDGIWSRLESIAQKETTRTGFFFNNDKGKNVKERCTSAYKLANFDNTNDTDEKPSKVALFKWCSVKGTATS